MSHPIQIDPKRPLYRAVPIVDAVEAIPLVVEEVAPLDVVEAVLPEVEEVVPYAKPRASAVKTPLVDEPRAADPVAELDLGFRVLFVPFRVIASVVGWLFGLAALLVGLAVLAA